MKRIWNFLFCFNVIFSMQTSSFTKKWEKQFSRVYRQTINDYEVAVITDNNFSLNDVNTGNEKSSINFGDQKVFMAQSLEYIKDKQYIATLFLSKDGKVSDHHIGLYDFEQGKLIRKLPLDQVVDVMVYTTQISSDKNYYFYGGMHYFPDADDYTGFLRIYDLTHNVLKHQTDLYQTAVYALALKNNQVIASGRDMKPTCKIKFFDTHNEKVIEYGQDHNGFTTNLLINNNNFYTSGACWDDNNEFLIPDPIYIWDMRTNKKVAEMGEKEQRIAFFNDNYLISGFDTTIKIWDVRTRQNIYSQNIASSFKTTHIPYVLSGTNGSVTCWEYNA